MKKFAAYAQLYKSTSKKSNILFQKKPWCRIGYRKWKANILDKKNCEPSNFHPKKVPKLFYLSIEEINSGFSFSNEAEGKWLLQEETMIVWAHSTH